MRCNVWFWYEKTQVTTGKNFKVDDSKFFLIGINLSFLKNLKISFTMFLKLHAQYCYPLPLLNILLISFLFDLQSPSHYHTLHSCTSQHSQYEIENSKSMWYHIIEKFLVSSFKFAPNRFFSLVHFKNSTDPTFQVTDVALLCRTEVSE